KLQRQALLVGLNGLHGDTCIRPERTGVRGARQAAESASQLSKVVNSRVHASNIFIHKRTGLDLPWRLIRNEILAESRQLQQQLVATPHEAHVRRENLVPRADQVDTTEC